VFSDVVIRGLSPASTSLVGSDSSNHSLWVEGADLRLEDLSLTGAEASGALSANNASIVMDNVSVHHNEGDRGILRLVRSTAELRDVSIHENIAGAFPVIANDLSLMTLTNVSITDNRSDGTFYFQYGEGNGTAGLTLNHVTLSGNAGSDLLAVESSEISAINSIISGNQVDITTLCISGTFSSLGGNVLGGNLGCLRTGESDRFTDEPLLEKAKRFGRGHYLRLQAADSPAIGIGLPQACVPLDLLGRPRPDACDAGALQRLSDQIFFDAFE
jgi:hypothetical protein